MKGAKETAANIGASAKAGMDKTKATVQEKATQKKEEKSKQAELDKQAAKQPSMAGYMGTATSNYSTTGQYGQPICGTPNKYRYGTGYSCD